MTIDSEFDGEREIRRCLEYGQSFGLCKATYGRLAQAAISASRFAGIEPSEIRRLDNEQPGCLCTLYGRHSAYHIMVEPRINRVSLSLLPLDASSNKPTEIFSGQDEFSDWCRIVNTMLRLEDFRGITREEAEAHLRSQGLEI
jgi:hypothetical protein